MSDYAIGDIQGCFETLQRLLCFIHFDKHRDRLWFTGDLVNRGPDSLAVLRFIKTLPLKAIITLGNHDLHLLSQLFVKNPVEENDDTLHDVINAPDALELGHWLRRQPILYHDAKLNIVMCHAGIGPMWTLQLATTYAQELEKTLSGAYYPLFLTHMYGNQPDHWSDDLTGMTRLRVICNYFTRMRFCNAKHHLLLTYKGDLQNAPDDVYPWYAVPDRKTITADIIFGHWAALNGVCPDPTIHALDTGCLWGGQLTALRLQDKKRFSVPGLTKPWKSWP